MTRYIDKAVIKAELERIEHETNYEPFTDEVLGKRFACRSLLSFLDTIEVKDVDLEKEIKDYFDSQPIITRSKGVDYRLIPTGVDIAKHFYELGLKIKDQ